MITWAFAKPGREINLLSRWVADLIWPGQRRDFGNCQGMAIIEDDQLIAGMIFHNYESQSGVIEISGAGTSKRWLTRETLRVMFAYPFKECGCQCIVMRCDPDDAALRRMLLAYGFQLFTIPRLRGRDKDENVFVLYDDAWRGNKFNKREKQPS
uniref:Putative acetyltransferase n=1 Tax=viral metagenome TaxID=1070528 RepID=A0A6H1ZB91_9ZZZZ